MTPRKPVKAKGWAMWNNHLFVYDDGTQVLELKRKGPMDKVERVLVHPLDPASCEARVEAYARFLFYKFRNHNTGYRVCWKLARPCWIRQARAALRALGLERKERK
jgi:hypothetical protein